METICKKVKEAAGGPAALAKLLGDVTPQAVSQWKKVPAGRVLEVERLTGISRYDIRPDVYGEPKAKRRAVSA